jgi:hypothetical protein
MSFPRDLVEVLAAFVEGGVRFLVIGGHAVSLHARPRATKDVDLWLAEGTVNVRRACVPFIGRHDLLANKRATGRPQDRRDVRALERAAARPRKK